MPRGASKRRAADAAQGRSPRRPGNGDPVDVTPDEMPPIPRPITNAIAPTLLAQLYAEALRINGMLRSVAERQLELVLELRDQGLSWQSVGWFLGISGQGARQTYGPLIEDAMSEDLGDGWGER